jgi:hypothetical protein
MNLLKLFGAKLNDTREKALVRDLAEACDRLNALRKSAYLRNGKGQIVRYTDAPAEVRERAETN